MLILLPIQTWFQNKRAKQRKCGLANPPQQFQPAPTDTQIAKPPETGSVPDPSPASSDTALSKIAPVVATPMYRTVPCIATQTAPSVATQTATCVTTYSAQFVTQLSAPFVTSNSASSVTPNSAPSVTSNSAPSLTPQSAPATNLKEALFETKPDGRRFFFMTQSLLPADHPFCQLDLPGSSRCRQSKG